MYHYFEVLLCVVPRVGVDALSYILLNVCHHFHAATGAFRDIAYDTFDTRHLLNWQRVNHFRNDRELCRKDLLVKNLKKR